MAPTVVVAGLESSRLAKLRVTRKTADQVGDGVEVLSVGQPSQLDARRFVSKLSVEGVKRIEDIAGHTLGFVTNTFFGIVIRHGPGDDAREFFDRPIAGKRLVVFIGDSLALLSVAIGAEFCVKKFTGQLRLGQGSRFRQQEYSG